MATSPLQFAPQRFSSHDKEQISFTTHGSPDRPAVFLLHGFRNSARSWFEKGKRYASGLAIDLEKAGYFVIAPDLRGHGQSARPVDASKYTKEQELYDVVALADHLEVKTFAVVGYSHGAIEAAKLLTIDRRVACGVLGGIGDKLADKDWSKPLELAIEFEAEGSQRSLALAGVQRGQSVTTPAELAGICVPVLCINGRGDVDNGSKEALSRLIPGSELAWVAGDHATATMDAKFCERIVSFLSASFPAGFGAAVEVDGVSVSASDVAKAQVFSIKEVSGDGDGHASSPAPLADHVGKGDGTCGMGKSEKGKGKVAGETSSYVDPKAPLRCPVMAEEEVAAITVSFEDIEGLLLSVLETHGSAVVTGVASEEDCQQLQAMFCEDLQEVFDGEALKVANADVASAAARVVRDPRSWPMASMEGLGKMNRCQLRGLPHGRFAWAARLNPRLRRVYEVLHGTTELVSSCDNSFFAPGSCRGACENRSWPHVDHNKHDLSVVDQDGAPISDWEVYQGLLYVWPSTDANSSTTVVWPGSHTDVYEELMSAPSVAARGRKGNHFSPFRSDNASLISRWHAAARRVPVPAGGLFIWNSKTVHQGWTGGPRLAQPVCWEPTCRRTERARVRKLWMAALGLPSTHWASLGLPHNLVAPRLQEKVVANGRGADVTLPMVSTLQPVTLADGVKVEDVWRQLSTADWSKPLPTPLMKVLERSIAAQYHAVL